MTLTDWLALYGAVLSTAVLAWDVRKWLTHGPRLEVHVMPRANLVGHGFSNEEYITATVTNVGDAATVITHFGFRYYSSWFAKVKGFFRTRTVDFLLVPYPALNRAEAFPHRLEPGNQWVGGTKVDALNEHITQKGILYLEILHSMSKKPVRKRIIFPTRNSTTIH